MFGGRFFGRHYFGARYWGEGGGADPTPTTARGGASYLTREEMRELARRQREIDRKRRKQEREIDESIVELYSDIKHPHLKVARIRAAQELDDEEALITMMIHYFAGEE